MYKRDVEKLLEMEDGYPVAKDTYIRVIRKEVSIKDRDDRIDDEVLATLLYAVVTANSVDRLQRSMADWLGIPIHKVERAMDQWIARALEDDRHYFPEGRLLVIEC